MQQKQRKPHQQRRQKPDTQEATVPATPENVEQDKQKKLDPNLYAPLPMHHMTSAYNKAKIRRKMRNGNLDIKRLSEITGIAEAEILPVFIEYTPDK